MPRCETHTPGPWAWQEAHHTDDSETAHPRSLITLNADEIVQSKHDRVPILVPAVSIRAIHQDAITDVRLEIHGKPADEALIAASPNLLKSLKKMTTMARFSPLTGHDHDQADIDEAEVAINQAEGAS